MPTSAVTGRRAVLWVGALTLLGLVHSLVIAPHYHFGSFDDDASYVLVAKALASGVGLSGRLSAGYPLVGAYPPGFAALLAPLALVAPGVVVLYRLVPLVLFAAIFPLTWVWLERRGVHPALGLSVLLLLALNPVLATFATMVMPETAFLVGLLVLLLVAERWGEEVGVVSWYGTGTVVLAAALLWLKEAAFGLVIGLACWLLIRLAWRKAAITVVGPALLLLPVLIARAVVRTPLIGSRYSDDLGVSSGGLVHRVLHVVPHSLSTMVASALPLSVVPTGVSPLPTHGLVGLVLDLVDWTLPAIVALGLVSWVRHQRDPSALVVSVYLLEILAYPFMNERRFVLVLPIVVTWYVFGVRQAISGVALARDRLFGSDGVVTRRPVAWAAPITGAVVALALVGAPLLAQFPRDYLYKVGQSSSAPDGSPYMALLRRLGSKNDVVETTYLWSTALFTGHRTARSAYRAPCDDPSVRGAVELDHGGYLLDAALNKPGQLESDCLLRVAEASSWAVPLLRTSHDNAAVFELIGAGTAHPDRVDLVAGPAVASESDLSWRWARPVLVNQVILGSGASLTHPPDSVTIELRQTNGAWITVASSSGPVGDRARTRFLAVEFPVAIQATAVRITAGGEAPTIQDFHVLGSNSI